MREIMACGDRYRNRIVTASGKTPADPCDWFCGPGDYTEWLEEAHRWHEAVKEAWDRLARVEIDRGIERGVQDPLRVEVLKYQAEHERLPSSMVSAEIETGEFRWSIREWIGVVGSNCLLAVCLLEQIEDATRKVGGEVRKVPAGPGQAPGENASTAVVWLAVAGGVVLSSAVAWRLAKMRRRW